MFKIPVTIFDELMSMRTTYRNKRILLDLMVHSKFDETCKLPCIKLPITQFSPVSLYLLFLSSKYFSQSPVFQICFMCALQLRRDSFAHLQQNNVKNQILMHFI
jgi:hypothetical protein